MVLAAQTQQNAQAGYAADYQCKRSAQSFNEVKEAKKGHHFIADKNSDTRVSYIGHRHVTRILSDYYGRGIVRSNQESTNLRAYAESNNVTAAESIKTCKNVVLPAAAALHIVEKWNPREEITPHGKEVQIEFDHRDFRNIKVVTKNAAFLYGMRPLNETERAPELKYLSLYDFPLLALRTCCMCTFGWRVKTRGQRLLPCEIDSCGLPKQCTEEVWETCDIRRWC